MGYGWLLLLKSASEMTRVVVQRGQASSSNARAAAPLPPPSTPLVSSSEEECGLPLSEDLDDKTEVPPCSEDDKAVEGAVTNNEEGRETPNALRYIVMAEEVERDSSDNSRQYEVGSFSGKSTECVSLGLEEEQLISQSEGVGLPKVQLDVCCKESCDADAESKFSAMQSKVDGLSSFKADGSSACVGGSSSYAQGATNNQPSLASMESGLQWTEVTASLPSSTLSAASGILPSSKRGGWSSPTSTGVRTAIGSSRKVWRSIKPSKSPPHSSRASSPRSYVEPDGYNSADEQNPWAMGQRGSEENDDRERQFEIEIRCSRGLEMRRMAEDGNCLFRAVADQVYGDAEMHGETRQMCIDYMEKERDHFSQFVTESFSAYCKRKRRDRVFGNDLEIQAMAEMYNRPIHIFCYGSEPKNIFQRNYETDLPPIRLSYHRNNHYNSLVDPNRPTVGAGLGFGSLNGVNIDRDEVKAAIRAQQDMQIDKALLAEGRYYSDLELTEQEMERMVIEESRAEFLAEEYGHQIGCMESSTSAAGTSTSQSDAFNHRLHSACLGSSGASVGSFPATNRPLTTNMRILLSMGFSYFRVVEACNIFGDDINDMLCYLLEAETGGLFEDSVHRLKGKAAER